MSLTPDCFLPPLLKLAAPASFLTSISFRWNPLTKLFQPLSPSHQRLHSLTTYLHASAVSSTLLQTLFWRDHDLSKLLISSFGLFVLTFTLITVWVYHLKSTQAIHLINSLIKMSAELHPLRGPLQTRDKLVKNLATLFYWSASAVPFAFVFGVVYTMPCLPSSFLLPLLPCPLSSLPFTPPIVLFILLNILLWSYSIQCAVFVVLGVTMLGASSLTTFLKIYHSLILPRPSNQAPLRVLYRRIQLLTNSLNDLHSNWILIPLLITVSSHQVFSTYGAIKFKGQLNFFSYSLFALLAHQGVLVILGMFTSLGDLYKTSKRIHLNLVRSHRGDKSLQRWHRACAPVKVMFGRFNYIDSTTPLVFENFAIIQTANILLLD